MNFIWYVGKMEIDENVLEYGSSERYCKYIMLFNALHEIYHALVFLHGKNSENVKFLYDEENDANICAASFWKQAAASRFIDEIYEINEVLYKKYNGIYDSFKKIVNGRLVRETELYSAFLNRASIDSNFGSGLIFGPQKGDFNARYYNAFQNWSIKRALEMSKDIDFNDFLMRKGFLQFPIEIARIEDIKLNNDACKNIIQLVAKLFRTSNNEFPEITVEVTSCKNNILKKLQ